MTTSERDLKLLQERIAEKRGAKGKTIKRQQKKRAKIKKVNKALEYMKRELRENGIMFEEEYKFHPTRKFRSDLYLKRLGILIEYEGTAGGKSRHMTMTGYARDCDKYNFCTLLGFRLLRYTILNYKNMMSDIDYLIKKDET